jgi:hypothetical protein
VDDDELTHELELAAGELTVEQIYETTELYRDAGDFVRNADEEDRAMLLRLAADPATPHNAVRLLVEVRCIPRSMAESWKIAPDMAAAIVAVGMHAAIENGVRAEKVAARNKRKREKQKRRGKR